MINESEKHDNPSVEERLEKIEGKFENWRSTVNENFENVFKRIGEITKNINIELEKNKPSKLVYVAVIISFLSILIAIGSGGMQGPQGEVGPMGPKGERGDGFFENGKWYHVDTFDGSETDEIKIGYLDKYLYRIKTTVRSEKPGGLFTFRLKAMDNDDNYVEYMTDLGYFEDLNVDYSIEYVYCKEANYYLDVFASDIDEYNFILEVFN